MKLSDELRSVKGVFPAIEHLLEAAAQRIEDARQWKAAWIAAENQVDLLTKELEQVRLHHRRKEKERND